MVRICRLACVEFKMRGWRFEKMVLEKLPLNQILKVSGGYAFKSASYTKKGTPLLRISNIKGNGIVFDEKTVYLNEKPEGKLKDYRVEEGDLLMALSGATTGKFGIYQQKEPCLLNQRVARIRINGNSKIKKFFYYQLFMLQKSIFKKAYGMAQPNISTKELGEFKVINPDDLDKEKSSTKSTPSSQK